MQMGIEISEPCLTLFFNDDIPHEIIQYIEHYRKVYIQTILQIYSKHNMGTIDITKYGQVV